MRMCVCVCVFVCLYIAWGDREADTDRGNKDTDNGSKVRDSASNNGVPAFILQALHCRCSLLVWVEGSGWYGFMVSLVHGARYALGFRL